MDVFRVRYCVNIFPDKARSVFISCNVFSPVKPPDFFHLRARATSEERAEPAFQFRAPQSEHAGSQRSRVEAGTCEDGSAFLQVLAFPEKM